MNSHDGPTTVRDFAVLPLHKTEVSLSCTFTPEILGGSGKGYPKRKPIRTKRTKYCFDINIHSTKSF